MASERVPGEPTEVAALKFMEMEWRDHFQTRAQTWRLLEIEALVAIALVGLDWRLGSTAATVLLASLLVVLAAFGAQLTYHHRKAEVGKIMHVYNVEKALGIIDKYAPEVTPMKPIVWHDVVSFRANASLYLMRIHFILIAFGVTYLIFRLFG